MPGRKYDIGSGYRYGFNGKENDNEVKGLGNQQDYGMRIYDPRLGRFLSMDPLMKSYPMLTPYQFSSNRPIDGVDLDGLEYLTVHVYFAIDKDGCLYIKKITKQDFRHMTEKQIMLAHGMSEKEFYSRFSATFGKEGRGIKWVYYYPDGTSNSAWEMQQKGDLRGAIPSSSEIAYHGIFSGPGSITSIGPNVMHQGPNTLGLPESNNYDYNEKPIDHVDDISKTHDMIQDKIVDYQGWLEDTRTLESDTWLLGENEKYRQESHDPNATYIDPITHRPASAEGKNRAEGIKLLFQMAVKYKTWKTEKLRSMGYDPAKAESQQYISLDDWKQGGLQQLLLQQTGGGKSKEEMSKYWEQKK